MVGFINVNKDVNTAHRSRRTSPDPNNRKYLWMTNMIIDTKSELPRGMKLSYKRGFHPENALAAKTVPLLTHPKYEEVTWLLCASISCAVIVPISQGCCKDWMTKYGRPLGEYSINAGLNYSTYEYSGIKIYFLFYFETIKNYRKVAIEWHFISPEPFEIKLPSWCPIFSIFCSLSLNT